MRRWAAVLALALALALCGAAGREKDVLLVVDADVQTLTLSVGKPRTPSPLGVFTVNQKSAGWGDGFGTRWIGFYCSYGAYGIHGTNQPASIGGWASHGCIRMLNRDVEALYPQVPYGAKVLIEREAYGPMGAGLRTLKPGARGADVMQVQIRLKNLGYYGGAADGVFGEGTKAALLRFKKEKGLEGDQVDWSCYRALGIQLFE